MTVLAAAIFFVSGFAALLYQVIWQRMLAIFSGADVYSVTIIVAAFMGGLGAGHLGGGYVADRVSRRAALMLFGASELAIALFGYFSSALYYGVLYRRFGHVPISPLTTAAILFASLLWPTFFMGASLPLLARTLTNGLERAASVIGVLYGFNTLGAATGALLSTWVLIPWLGLEGSVRLGAMLNLVCFTCVLPAAVVFRWPDTVEGRPQTPADPRLTADPTFPFVVWAAIFALSGFMALSLEIVWFRLLGIIVKSGAFTFGTLLGVYLGGIGLGALAGARLAPRLRQPATAFLYLQAVGALGATLLLTLFIRVGSNLAGLRTYLDDYDSVDVARSVHELIAVAAGLLSGSDAGSVPWTFIAVYVAIPLVLVLPPTLLMGMSFPVLQRVVQTDLARVGSRLGFLLLANIAGSLAGATIAGLILLDAVGAAGTLRFPAIMGATFLWLAFSLTYRGRPPAWSARLGGHRTAAALATAAAAFPILASAPETSVLWARLHGAEPQHIVASEDRSGVSVINVGEERATVFVNGLGQSWLPYGEVHTALGALPAFIHPAPRSAVVIGLGSGDTLHALAGRKDLEQITCVEIIRPQLDTLRALHGRFEYAGVQALLADPRIEHVFGDGRIHLMRGGRRYDLIEADALRPSSAYSGTLYSVEYFELLRDHLNPGGLATTWAPTGRVVNAFLRVFPHVVQLPEILIGSRDPIAVDRVAVARRLADSGAREYYAAAGLDIDALMKAYLSNPVHFGPDVPRDSFRDFNADLFPRDEYDLGLSR